jgi:5-methylcytosine-specific restriction endonuclease McrA
MQQLTLPFNSTSSIPISDKLGNLRCQLEATLAKSSKKRIRYAAVSVSEVLERVAPSGSSTGRYDNWKFINGIDARVSVVRLRAFARNLKCVCCGRVGNVFLLERHINEMPGQYVNLYSLNHGALTLMTVDHILPDSIGGKYTPDNFQTMCHPCNEAKKNHMPVKDIEKVLADMDRYAKCWVNRDLLSALLRAQRLHLTHHSAHGPVQAQFWTLYVKYSSSIRSGDNPIRSAQAARTLNHDLAVWTHIANNRHWIVVAYAKLHRWVASLFPLSTVA